MADNSVSRKEREREQHRNAILEAALMLFSEKGYESVSVSEIAEKAEFATGTLYNFFESKEGLFREIVLRYLGAVQNRLNEVLDSDKDELSKLRSFIRVKGELVHENMEFIHLYMHDLRSRGFTSVQKDIMHAIGEIHIRLEAVFRKGVEKGIFKDLDPYIMGVAFNGLSSIFIFHMIHFPDTFSYFENIDTIMEMFFENILLKDTSDEI